MNKRILTAFLLGAASSSTLAFVPLTTTRTSLTTAPPRATNVWYMAVSPQQQDYDGNRSALTDAEMEVSSSSSSSSSAPKQTRKYNNNPTPALVAAWQNIMGDDDKKSTKPAAMALALALMLATTFATVNPAWAAMSGGRVGGGGYGRSSSPAMSRPAPTRSYSSGGYYGGSTYGYSRPRTNVYINPGPAIISPF